MAGKKIELVMLLKALSDPTRLKLVEMLGTHGHILCVNALAAKLGITQSAVSQHLRILRQAGLVAGERTGHHVHYKLDRRQLEKMKKLIDETLG